MKSNLCKSRRQTLSMLKSVKYTQRWFTSFEAAKHQALLILL
jgi:hypothetical protein